MKIKKFTFNPFQENTYLLIAENNDCIIFDPGMYQDSEIEEFENYISDNKLQPIRLINTHCHLDHICSNKWVADKYSLKLEAHKLEHPNLELSVQAGKLYNTPIIPSPEIELFLDESSSFIFDEKEIKILFTPGHSAGSISFYIESINSIISGDVIFNQSIGRTDLPGGSHQTLLESIEREIYTLPEETTIYSGHGPETNVGFEMKHNPFIRL